MCIGVQGYYRNRFVLHIRIMMWFPSSFETGMLGLMSLFSKMNEIRVRDVVLPSMYIHICGPQNIHKCELQSLENYFLVLTYDGCKLVTGPKFRE